MNKTNLILLLSITCLFKGGGLFAQNQQTLLSESWVRSGGLNLNAKQSFSKFDLTNNVYVAGTTLNSSGNSDILIQKFNRKGLLLWSQTYNGTADLEDNSTALFVDNASNVYVTGSVTNIAGNGGDLAVLKYNSSGVLQWTYFYTGIFSLSDDTGISIVGNNIDFVAVTGTSSNSSTLSDFITISLNPLDGSLNWLNTYDHASLGELPRQIRLGYNGAIDIFGTSQSSSNPIIWDLVRVSYNGANGSLVDVHRTAQGLLEGLDGKYDMSFDNNAGVYVAGTSLSIAGAGFDIATYKLDYDLSVLWSRHYDQSNLEDKGNGIGVDENGNVFTTGYVSTSNQGKNAVLLKYDSNGSLLWNSEFNGLANLEDVGVKLAIADSDHIFLAATIRDIVTSNSKIIGFSADGDIFGMANFDGDSHLNDSPEAILIDIDGDVLVNSTSQLNNTAYQNETVKYSVLNRSYDLVYEGVNPVCLKDNLLIRFSTEHVNMATIDKRELLGGTLDQFIDANALAEIQAKTGENWENVKAYKVYKHFTSGDSLSISRLGDTIRYGSFYTLLSVDVTIADMNVLLDSLSACNSILYAQPNLIYSPTSVTQDEQFHTNQYGLFPNNIFPDADIDVAGAWDMEAGGNLSTKVAIIDNPVDYRHPDLNGFGASIAPTNKIGGGYNVFSDINVASLPYGTFTSTSAVHGTKVAGVIGAHRNNFIPGNDSDALGVAGIAGGNSLVNQGVQLYSLGLSATSSVGSSFTEYLVQAMRIAYTNNPLSQYPDINAGYAVDVINLSWGSLGLSGQGSDPTVTKELKDCWRNHCTFVTARGNGSGFQDENYRTSPACNADNLLLTVIASGTNGERKVAQSLPEGNGYADWHSLQGITAVNNTPGCDCDVMAPGTIELVATTTHAYNGPGYPGVYCGVPDVNYSCFNGTSAAAPHVSGVSALMLNHHRPETDVFYPNRLAPEDLEHIMEKTAEDRNAIDYDNESAYGLLNAKEALIKVHDPYYVIHSPHVQLTTTNDFTGTVQLFEVPGTVNGFGTGYRKKHTFTIQMDLPSGHEVIDWWWLKSRLYGGAGVSTNLISYDGIESPAVTITNQIINVGTSSATLSGYFYTWDFNQNGQWRYDYPRSASELNTAFSLHVYRQPDASIKEIADSKFTIFPNPSSTSFKISFPTNSEAIEKITITDALGRVVFYQTFQSTSSKSIEVFVDQLNRGIYYVTILNDSGKASTQPFIKN